VRKTNLFVMTCVLAVSAPTLMAAPPESSQACWQPAFEAGDADAVLWLPGAPMMQGRDAIRAGYVDFFAGATIKSARLTELGKASHGNEASSWGTFTVVTVSKTDGKETTETGRYTDVSRRINGRWQYLVDHASDDPAAAGD
jgi:ketosteroid isomerase-like protein